MAELVWVNVYSQDVDSDHMFTPQPSNTSLDSGSGSGSLSMAGRSVSVTGAGAASFMPRSIVRYRPDSPPPLTKRTSVSFVRDLTRVGSGGCNTDKIGGGVAGRHVTHWTFKRQCMSVGDSIDERVESTDTDYLSVRSLATPAVAGPAGIRLIVFAIYFLLSLSTDSWGGTNYFTSVTHYMKLSKFHENKCTSMKSVIFHLSYCI